jgi:hypothetical protein
MKVDVYLIVAIVCSALGASVPAFVAGYRSGKKHGATEERRAGALRRLKGQQETEWVFRVKAGKDSMDIYGHAPDGHEYTREYVNFNISDPKKRRELGYDDAWYEVDTATPVVSQLHAEITRRFNTWNVLTSTGARKKPDDFDYDDIS